MFIELNKNPDTMAGALVSQSYARKNDRMGE